jgi:hypothetical protein
MMTINSIEMPVGVVLMGFLFVIISLVCILFPKSVQRIAIWRIRSDVSKEYLRSDMYLWSIRGVGWLTISVLCGIVFLIMRKH